MSETNDLIVLPKETALTVFTTPAGLDPYLQKIRDEINSFVPNTKTLAGRKEIASIAHKVARSKVALDEVGKELVADLKDVPKKIDAERKRMRDLLDQWKDEVRKPLTEWEEAEAARVQAHQDAVMGISAFVTDCGQFAESVRSAIEAVESITIGPSWEEFEAEAARTKDKTLSALRERLAEREAYEAEQAELARLRAEAAAREQKEREERIAREAAERAQREAELRAQAEREAVIRREQETKAAAERRELELKLAAEKAEREKVEAQQREEQTKREAQAQAERAAAAERQRIADEQAAAQAEAQRREADKAHKAKVNRAAVTAFVEGGFSEEQAKNIVSLIAKKMVPNVSISY